MSVTMETKENVVWFSVDEYEARGRIGVTEEAYGFAVYVEDPKGAYAYVDLYYGSEAEMEGQEKPLGYKQILFFEPGLDEPLLKVLFTPEGLRVVLNKDAEDLGETKHGIYYGDREFGFSPGAKET